MRLKDRVAIITGAAHGIGRAYTFGFAAEGAKVVIADIDGEAGNEVAEAINGKGGQALALRIDVSKEHETVEMARRTVERFGRIDILINNAAVVRDIEPKPFNELSLDEWNREISTVATGSFLCIRAVFPQMKAQGKGKIINDSSETVLWGPTHYPHYVTSKAAIIGLTRALARELGDFGIRVNSLATGLAMCDWVPKKYPQGAIDMRISQQCLKQPLMPEDIVGAALFLASDDSDMITGQNLAVNAGWMMH